MLIIDAILIALGGIGAVGYIIMMVWETEKV